MSDIEKRVIEVIGIPILTKAIDFLFSLAKEKLLRRPSKSGESEHTERSRELGEIHENLLHSKVQRGFMEHYLEEINALLTQLEIHHRNHSKALEQKAKWGEALVPPIIENTIRDEYEAIQSKGERLRNLLESATQIKIPKDLLEI